MEFPTVLNWTCPFPIVGLLGCIFYFYSYFKSNFCKQTVDNLFRRRILHCLSMSDKKDARLIWVNSGLVYMFKLKDNIKNKPKILLSQSYIVL